MAPPKNSPWSAPPKNSPWSDAAEHKLMLCALNFIVKPDWKAVATAMGDEFTSAASLSSSTFHIHNQYLPTHFLTSQSYIIMVFKWDSESERSLLLLTITKMQGPKATIWPAVAEELGHGLNASACSQKFYKLKKESEKLLGNDGPAASATTTPKSAKAKGENATPGKATSGKRKKATADQDADETPTKKKSKAAPTGDVKQEPEEEGNGDTVKVEADLEVED
ncbi:hypothetical protein LTR10_017591 [Elasticomyces elasticus]|nr:hypothetical protein LTR10_017591 [Elasticomyces elasticus]